MNDNVISIEDFKKKKEEEENSRKLGLAQSYQANKEIGERIKRVVETIRRINSLMKELREKDDINKSTSKDQLDSSVDD